MASLRSILIVDDEPSIRHTLTLALSDKGYAARAVGDGQEALRELSARPYDVVITDVRMPKLGGLELLEQIRAQHPQTTVIVMSAYGAPDAALEAVKKGAFDYVQKPFKPE